MRVCFRGDRLREREYGTATIIDIDDRPTVGDFDDHEVRSPPLVELRRRSVPGRPRRRASRPRPSRVERDVRHAAKRSR